MPGSLFYHHYLNSLNHAVETLKAQCQESGGSPAQKAFNIDSQIPLMEKALQSIKEVEINFEQPDWNNFRILIQDIIDQAKTDSIEKKETKQKDTGTTISTLLITEFGNKLLALFDELHKDTQTNFLTHRENDKALYISSDYSSSPFLNQLINVAIGYRISKITEKHLTGEDFSSKHQDKFTELTETITLWEKHKSNKNLTLKEYKNTVNGVLNNLIEIEQKIQCEVGKGIVGNIRGWGMWIGSKYTEEPDSLRVSLPLLKQSFLRDCTQINPILDNEDEIPSDLQNSLAL